MAKRKASDPKDGSRRGDDAALAAFWEKLDGDAEFARYYSQVAGDPEVAPAKTGRSDPFLRRLTRGIKPHDFPFVVLDFGCGYGRFLAALLANEDLPLHNIHYVGVDSSQACIDGAEAFAKACDAHSILGSVGFCSDLELLPRVLEPHHESLLPERLWVSRAFMDLPYRVHYAFFINVLHELPFAVLFEVLDLISFMLPKNGQIWVQELPWLPKAEGSFLPWDRDSLRCVFGVARPFEPRAFRFRSRLLLSTRGVPVVHAHATKLLDDYDYVGYWAFYHAVLRDAFPMMKSKAHIRLAVPGLTRGELIYHKLALATIADYEEVDEIVAETLDTCESTPRSPARCPKCRRSGVSIEYEARGGPWQAPKERTWTVTCRHCDFRGYLALGRHAEGQRTLLASSMLNARLEGRFDRRSQARGV